MTRRRVLALGAVAATSVVIAAYVLHASSSRRVAENLTGFDLRRASQVVEVQNWPGLGNNGYSLFVFKVDEPRFSAVQCETLGYQKAFRGALPGFDGRPPLSPENCYTVRHDKDGTRTTVVFAADQSLFVSISK